MAVDDVESAEGGLCARRKVLKGCGGSARRRKERDRRRAKVSSDIAVQTRWMFGLAKNWDVHCVVLRILAMPM